MIYSLAIILLFGFIFAKIFEKIDLPPLIGMIIVGIIIGPNLLNLIDKSVLDISAEIRKIALIIILLRAGLNLTLDDLKKVGRPAILMCFVPALFEIIGFVILGPILFNLSLIDSLLLGAVISAVSPAVIVPQMIHVIENKYGTKEGVPQMILAGASADDVFVIALFTSFLGLSLGGDFNFNNLINIPISIFLGIVVGGIFAYLIGKILNKSKIDIISKLIVIISFSFFISELEIIAKNYIAISGLIGVMTFGLVYRQKGSDVKEISLKLDSIWKFAQIFLFVLLGMSFNISYVQKAGINAVLIILLALIFRLMGVYISLIKTKFTKNEKIFSMISYIPKATVQAAIGGIPLAMGVKGGEIILILAVISILITAPIGSILIEKTYRKLLKKEIIE